MPTRGPVLPYPAHAYDLMREWNIKILGARQEDPDAFLIRIEEGRSLVPICGSDLLRVMPFFLSGIALNWYRRLKSLWRTYADFAHACRARFSDPDFQFELRQEIYGRTQEERESVSDYLICMRVMFDKLSPPLSESEEISYAHRNLLPRLHLALHRADARSFPQLKYLPMNAEKGYWIAKAYRPPPNPDRSFIPELAYHEPTNRGVERRREVMAMMDEGPESPAWGEPLVTINVRGPTNLFLSPPPRPAPQLLQPQRVGIVEKGDTDIRTA